MQKTTYGKLISDWSSDVCSSALGWWSAPRDLTIHVPPDLRSGSTRKWWDVPPESVYAFTFYVFQTLNRWPTNGEEDYARNLHTLSPYLTPSCQAFLRADYDYRRSTGELRQRVRGIYEIPGRGYGDDPTRSEEHTSALQSIMRHSYAVFCLNQKTRLHTYTQ